MRAERIGVSAWFWAFIITIFLSTARAGTFDPAIDPNSALGLGFDTVKGEVRGECVEGQEVSAATEQGEKQLFSLLQVENTNQLRQLLNVSASASFAGTAVEARGKATLLKSILVNNYSIYVLASVLIEHTPTRLSRAALTQSAKDLLAKKGSLAFRQRCGDEYISGWISGGEYHAIIDIATSSSEEQENIAADIGGAYGVFSGSAEFSNAITKIAKHNQLRIYVYTSGGSRLVAATTPDKMVKDAAEFATKLTERGARRIVAVTQRYDALELPEGPSPVDIQHQVEIIRVLSEISLSAKDAEANLRYILFHRSEFRSVDQSKLNDGLSQISKIVNKVNQQYTECYNDISKCKLPEDITVPNISLPARIHDQLEVCEQPLFKERTDQLCGVERFRVGRGDVCGVELYADGRGPVCGVQSYKLARTSACEPEAYIVAKDPKCGGMEVILPDFGKSFFHAPDFCAKMGADGVSGDNCVKYKSCALPEHGVALYKECRNQGHGVEQYATCRNASFGVERYAECESEKFGIATYKTCRRSEFGLEQCLKKKS